ncbi:Nn.00g088410.m01.CDS01 [Neocucurbitaria sp. VM-36]
MNKLEKWQDLCREVHIMDTPASITQCKKVLGSRNVRVNIVNLINHRLIGEKVIRFKSDEEFRAYTKDRTFPREAAKEEGFLKALLKQL